MSRRRCCPRVAGRAGPCARLGPRPLPGSRAINKWRPGGGPSARGRLPGASPDRSPLAEAARGSVCGSVGVASSSRPPGPAGPGAPAVCRPGRAGPGRVGWPLPPGPRVTADRAVPRPLPLTPPCCQHCRGVAFARGKRVGLGSAWGCETAVKESPFGVKGGRGEQIIQRYC